MVLLSVSHMKLFSFKNYLSLNVVLCTIGYVSDVFPVPRKSAVLNCVTSKDEK
jgi:hypothetical protein